nr:uncharacterized mitochondrial protein AtMg00810-like [Tanacetum cinerariifolium]
MFDCDEFFTFKSDESLPPSPIYDMYQLEDSYAWSFQAEEEPTNYALVALTSSSSFSSDNEETKKVQKTLLKQQYENFIGLSSESLDQIHDRGHEGIFEQMDLLLWDLICQRWSVTIATRKDTLQRSVGLLRIQERMDWVSESEDASEAEIAYNAPSFVQPFKQVKRPRPVTADVPKPHVTRPRKAKNVVTKSYSPPRRHINHSPSPKASTFSPKVIVAEAPMVNAVKGNWDKGFIDSGYSRHMTGNMSYLSVFEELNGGYVAFGGNPKSGKISGKEKAREKSVQQYVFFPVWSFGSNNPQNTDGDAAFEVKEPEFEGRKPQSEVHVSPSSSAQIRKHDDKTKRDAKVAAVGQISTNNTNTFSDAGPSNAAVSPTQGKSSHVDTSQYLDDPNMPELEDITYSDDEEDVGVEVDFTNLETSITVSHILTTRVHKDHPVTQIIVDLSSAAQTKKEPKRVHQALKDLSWIKAMQEELLQFKMQKVWILVDLPHGKKAIGFKDLDYPDKVYKVVKALYGLHQAPRACQDKYVVEILRKFRLTEGKSASTPIDTEKPLLKDPDGEDVDVHTYRSMIGSLMYLTSSRPDIMFAVCACVRFQVTPKASYLHVVKRIFRYLKGKPHLGLWYSKDSPFDLVAYSDSDYAGASLDRKSTTRGCQFLGCRLISWQCKKQTVVATSSTEAKYVDWVSDSEDASEAEIAHNAPSFVQPSEQVKRPRHVVPSVVLTKSKFVPIPAARPVTADVPKPHVTRPRKAKNVVTKSHSPPRRHINHSPSPKASTFSPKVIVAEAPMVNVVKGNWGNPQHALQDKGFIDSGCSRHMTGNMSYLSDFEELNGGYVAFGGNPKSGKISGKGKIRTGKLDFDDVDDVYFVKELKFNLFSVSQMCDKKNSVLFTDTECLVLSPEFKLPDENQVLLRVHRENNMIKRKFSVPRTPQQNGSAERKNRTLIEPARTMLADSLLPIPFWAEAVNTACYV